MFHSARNTPKKIKIHSRYEKGFPRYFIEEYSNAPVFESLYTLVRHYQRVPFSVEKCPLILKRPIEEPRNFAKETYVLPLEVVEMFLVEGLKSMVYLHCA